MTNEPEKSVVENGTPAVVQKVDWQDFRDHLATADKEGRRKWIYPRKPHGRFYRGRTWFSGLLLAIMFAGPFITIHGEPLLLVNIVERKFAVLGRIFWPQDALILAVGLLVLFTGIAFFTAAYGRLWCGWACPQTVMMEMVFRKIEYAIEGDAPSQRNWHHAPWGAAKISRKLLKHGIFFALSFLIGNVLLSYIIGWQQLWQIITDPPSKHLVGLAFMTAFALLFYGIFARFREQACTFICPYGRFQSVLLDENSIVVAYDRKRGENRGPLRHEQGFEARRASGFGDCVACQQCVAVCPTGIDIRDGTQMECVHCTACIDACDAVMDKIGRPRGLVRYASLNGIERGERLKFTPRLGIYTTVLVALAGLEAFLVFTRTDLQTTLLRAPGALFQQMPDGRLSNLYTVRVLNKTDRELPVQLKLENPSGALQTMSGDIVVPPGRQAENSLLIELDLAALQSAKTPIFIGVYQNGKRIDTLKTVFIGPRTDAH